LIFPEVNKTFKDPDLLLNVGPDKVLLNRLSKYSSGYFSIATDESSVISFAAEMISFRNKFRASNSSIAL